MTTMTGIARRSVPYGLPTVDLHRILVNFALDPASPEFKAPLNQVWHSRGLPDPSDVSVVAMNVDTPYSWAWLDLRGGPVLLTMPPHKSDRYMSAMISDLYSNIVGYVSPRTAGHSGGTFLVRGPAGGEPLGPVDGVFESPTHLAVVLIRTQLFSEDDLAEVAFLQDCVEVTPLGEALPLPDHVATVDVRAPLDLSFLRALGWMLEFMPTLTEDEDLREELTGLGLGLGMFDQVVAEPTIAQEIVQGLAQGAADVRARCASVRSSAELFGSREFYAGDYLARAAGAYLGILGNSSEEYLSLGYSEDADDRRFNGKNRYAITFAPHGLPPVDAFWSITVYDAAGHLWPNPLDRYVLGSRQLPQMTRDAGGGLTILIQTDPVRDGWMSNWLPCPPGPFQLAFRAYQPGDAIRERSWVAPPVRRLL